jgi:hypothetical protein
MSVARKSGPGREYSIAIDWRDCAWSPRIVVRRPVAAHLEGVLPKSFSASDVGQTFLSAGSGDFPVPGFRVKLSALVREVGKLRNRQARKAALQFGQHALKMCPRSGHRRQNDHPLHPPFCILRATTGFFLNP